MAATHCPAPAGSSVRSGEMSDQRRHSPDDDTELLLALRTLGADYEPDVTAIARRPREPVGARNTRAINLRARNTRAPAVARHGRSVLLPAAAVLVLIGGIVLATS